MLRITRLTDYATVVMACMATRSDDVLHAAQIADAAQLEQPTVSKLLKSLGQAGLVESFRGVNGGYCLARAADAINLAQIVEAMEGPIGMTACANHQGQCKHEAQCGVRVSWQRINHILDDALRAVSLADVLQPTAHHDTALHFSPPLKKGNACV